MVRRLHRFRLSGTRETDRFAAALGKTLVPGDTVLLRGDMGAGKTHFARALIQSRLQIPEDVPSPTFTLVQTYDTDIGEIWHADLYRLSSLEEVDELGLTEAFETAICLIEWPERLGVLSPDEALDLSLTQGPTDTARAITAMWHHSKWDAAMSQVLA